MNVNHGFITKVLIYLITYQFHLKIPRDDFLVSIVLRFQIRFLEKMKQISSSKNSNDSSNKARIDTLSQLQTQIETLHDEKAVLQNTLAQKEICIDNLNKDTVIQDTLTQKEEHIETLQDRITELQDERKERNKESK